MLIYCTYYQGKNFTDKFSSIFILISVITFETNKQTRIVLCGKEGGGGGGTHVTRSVLFGIFLVGLL